MRSSVDETLEQINSVMAEYQQKMTIRQIYYRLIAEYGLENSEKSYKRIVKILSDARLSGSIPYDAIHDLGRQISEFDSYKRTSVRSHMNSLRSLIKQWDQFHNMSLWEGQPQRVLVVVEKQALQGIFSDVCKKWEVDLMVCKGYPSLTQQYELVNRMNERIKDGQELNIIYYGDFDPSGENIRDKLEERLRDDFCLDFSTFTKEALTMDQVVEMNLPPAPAKASDSRTNGFIDKYGVGIQVELDAIKPVMLERMISDSISKYFDFDISMNRKDSLTEEQERIRKLISAINIDSVVDGIKEDDS